jgi:hypothetical protein
MITITWRSTPRESLAASEADIGRPATPNEGVSLADAALIAKPPTDDPIATTAATTPTDRAR